MKKDQKQVAVVTGGNRGIGFEVCRQLGKQGIRVILGARDAGKGEKAAALLRAEGLDVTSCQLDVTSEASIERAARLVGDQFGGLDILVNNAGVFLDSRDVPDEEESSIFKAKIETLRETLETNTFGAIRMAQAFVPLMRKNRQGRIVNVSSGMGQLSEMNGGCPGYRLSKVGINAVTRILADELKDTGILVNSACPGWVKTEMGGPDAERSVEEGADTLVWLATLPANGPTGGFFRDRKRIEW